MENQPQPNVAVKLGDSAPALARGTEVMPAIERAGDGKADNKQA
jgi:hypothetical protein